MLHNLINSPLKLKTSATYTHLKINNKKFKVIIDSGAESTLMNYKTAKLLDLIIKEPDDNVKYIAANGETLKTMGWSIIEVEMASYKFHQKCIIINNLSTDVLLGTDTLNNHGMILNYKDKTIGVGNVVLKLMLMTY